jgi:RNA polymerase sigma factor (sigma-70 family)
MTDVNDMDLVRRYADSKSEPAFAELVHRHINLVYSVALRCVNNVQDAQDVTQAVFVILAKKAAGLREHTTLTGWLYETTRFTAMGFLRTKTRRQFREQEAYMQSNLNESDASSAWQQLAPLLENAMTRLNEKERTVLALRFFENKSGTETAALLRIQEWAAHKRMGRALEKLRKFFSKRGMTFSAATIAGAMSAHSVQAAPVGLAKTISVVAMTKGAAAGGSTLALVKGALKIMAWTKAKTAVVVGVGVLLAAGTTTVTVKEIRAHETYPWQVPNANLMFYAKCRHK